MLWSNMRFLLLSFPHKGKHTLLPLFKSHIYRSSLSSHEEHHRPCCLTKDASSSSSSSSSRSPPTLVDLVKQSIDMSPETMRRFWRVSAFRPDDFLKVLLGIFPRPDGASDSTRKVRFLWHLFQWAAETHHPHFHQHLPSSCKYAVASLLVRAGMFQEAAEFLLSQPLHRPGGGKGHGIYSDVILGFVADRDLERSMSFYRRARALGVSPSASCFQKLLRFLLETEEGAHSFLTVYLNMVELGLARGDDCFLRVAVRTLCRDNSKVQEAADLVRRVGKSRGMLLDPVLVVDVIADAYCDKRDFDALLCFLEELACAPSVRLCNKIISSICGHSGADRAWAILQNLQVLGFKPNSRTFTIFICWSCKERKLRNAFVYFSELLLRNQKPDVYAYNALISGLFREGMWKYAREVFTDMAVAGVTPAMTTFRVVLAGYCRERQFDESRLILQEMVNRGMASLAPWEDAVSKAFTLLGLDSLHVKIKRLNDMKLQKAEFFDSIGNGLFLDTDSDEYDKILTGVLDNTMVPDFNLEILEECHKGNTQKVISMKEEAIQHAQKLSLHTYSALLKILGTSFYDIEGIIDLFEEMQEVFDQLDHQTLNLFVQILSKKGIVLKASLVLDVLFRRQLPIENETFTALIIGSYRERNQKRFRDKWEVAKRSGWLPGVNDFKVFVSCLCKSGMLKEALELFWGMSEKYPYSIPATRASFLKQLCISGSSSLGYTLVKEEVKEGQLLDHKVYKYLIKGFCKEGKFSEALEVLDILLSENISLAPTVCQLLIPPLLGLGDIENAMTLKQVLLGSQSQISLSLYKLLISELCKTGNVNEANHLLLEMMTVGLSPDGDILNMIIDGYAREDNSSKAYEALCFMLKMDMDLTLSTYRSLIRLNSVQSPLVDCLNLRKVFVKDSDSRSLTFYNILIFYLFQAGKSQLVEVVLDEMQVKKLILDHVSYNFLVFGYYICGDTAKSVEAIKAMLSRDLVPSSRSFRIVINHLCMHFNIDEALELSKAMAHWGVKHGSMVQNALIESLLSHGKLEEACLLLTHLDENGLVSNKIYYGNLIRKFCEHWRVDKAINLLNLMLRKGNLLSEASYNSIVNGLLVQKEFDQALDFHAEMQYKNLRPSLETCIELVQGLCGSGRTDDARMLLEATVHSGLVLPSSIIYLVIDQYNAENDIHKATELLHKMQQNGYLPDFETHWSLVSNFSDTSNKNNERREGFLSHLLSQSGVPFEDSKVKSTTSK